MTAAAPDPRGTPAGSARSGPPPLRGIATAVALLASAAVAVGAVLWTGADGARGGPIRRGAAAVAEGRYEQWVVADLEAAAEFRRALELDFEDELGLAAISTTLREARCPQDRGRARSLATDLLAAVNVSGDDADRRRSVGVRDTSCRARRELRMYLPGGCRPILHPAGEMGRGGEFMPVQRGAD